MRVLLGPDWPDEKRRRSIADRETVSGLTGFVHKSIEADIHSVQKRLVCPKRSVDLARYCIAASPEAAFHGSEGEIAKIAKLN